MVYGLETSLLSVIVSYKSRQCYYVSAVKSVIDVRDRFLFKVTRTIEGQSSVTLIFILPNTGGGSMKVRYLVSKVFYSL